MIKQIQHSFNYMARIGNETNLVLFILCFALFFILVGVGLAWGYSEFVEWKLSRKHYSIDDLIRHTNKSSKIKIRRVKL